MDSWQRFNETSLPDKEAFYSNLNMEDITDDDYRHGKKQYLSILLIKLLVIIMIYMFKVIIIAFRCF